MSSPKHAVAKWVRGNSKPAKSRRSGRARISFDGHVGAALTLPQIVPPPAAAAGAAAAAAAAPPLHPSYHRFKAQAKRKGRSVPSTNNAKRATGTIPERLMHTLHRERGGAIRSSPRRQHHRQEPQGYYSTADTRAGGRDLRDGGTNAKVNSNAESARKRGRAESVGGKDGGDIDGDVKEDASDADLMHATYSAYTSPDATERSVSASTRSAVVTPGGVAGGRGLGLRAHAAAPPPAHAHAHATITTAAGFKLVAIATAETADAAPTTHVARAPPPQGSARALLRGGVAAFAHAAPEAHRAISMSPTAVTLGGMQIADHDGQASAVTTLSPTRPK